MLWAFRLLSLAAGTAALVKTVELINAATDVVNNAAQLTKGFHG